MKRCQALRPLSVEHQASLALALRLLQAADTATDEALPGWLQMVDKELTILAPHFTMEEQILVPLLIEAGAGELAARLVSEHLALRAVADASLSDQRTRLRNFAELLRAHVRFEEREVFELAQQMIPADKLAEAFSAH